MRIAHLIGHLNFGGAERQVVNLLNAMAHLEPVLILSDGRGGDLLSTLDRRVEVVSSPCRLAAASRDVYRLAKNLRLRNIDVLHSHMFWPSVYGSVGSALARTPLFVTTEHGQNPWKRSWHRWVERNIISRRARLRICVSEEIACARRADGVPEEQLTVLSNGTCVTPDTDRAPISNRPQLLAVGRLIDAKGYPILVEAIRGLRMQGQDVLLQVAGDGPWHYELQQLTATTDLNEVVHWLGSRSDVPSLMRDSDIFVLSSIREGQPVVILEAMMAAMPIVATRVGAIPRTLADGREALLVPPGDPIALSAAILRLIQNPDFARRLGKQARQRAVAEFSIEAVAHAHLRIYERLLRE